MRYSIALAAAAAVTPIVSAHGAGVPNIVGLDPKDLKARDMLSRTGARFAGVHEIMKRKSEARIQNIRRQDDRQCGAGIGSCAAGECCSGAGYCGTDPDYCFSPGCDYEHGPACPENLTPGGTNTSSVARPKLGNVQYGGNGIYSCSQPGTVAITYDDGPQKVFTSHILDVMAKYKAKATFFITGNNINKGQIDLTPEFVSVIKRMDSEGHQIASHTWTHLDLSAISKQDRHNQMIKNEMALRNIVGKIPTYMRPPYSSCTAESGCEQDLADLGYHVTYFDLDTDDYEHDDPTQIQYSKDVFKGNVTSTTPANGQWLEIGHDIHEQTAMNLTEYMLSTLTQLGYKAVTVGECLGDPAENWYRTAGGAGTGNQELQGLKLTEAAKDADAATSGKAAITSAITSESGASLLLAFGLFLSFVSPTTTKPSSPSAPATSAPASTGPKKVSTDATCGGKNGFTCAGSTFGNCCSVSGWCGSTADYCGTGCQTAFGNCGSNGATPTKAATPKPTTAKPSPTATHKVSTDATCGGKTGFTCAGSSFGNCCSVNGWCGSTAAYCGTGCQSAFGKCT